MLQENVDESKALVKSCLDSVCIAQCKLAKDEARLAEVARTGKGGVGQDNRVNLEEWEKIDVNQQPEKECAKQTPDVPGVSAGRPSDDTPENHLTWSHDPCMDLDQSLPPYKSPPSHPPTNARVLELGGSSKEPSLVARPKPVFKAVPKQHSQIISGMPAA